MSGIFISYRREDSSGHAGRLYDLFARHFGKEQVFMDIDTIRPGVDFVEVIHNAVGSCEVLIAVIGKRWLTGTDESGRRRLDNPDDFISLEIAAALDRNIRVIPALVGGAEMPKTDLPEPLAKLARRQAIEISNTRFHDDVDRLIKAVEEVIGKKGKAKDPPSRFRLLDFLRTRAFTYGLALGILVLTFLYFIGSQSTEFQPTGKSEPARSEPTPPPRAVEPTVTLTASPTTIQKGQSSTLTWSSTNATKVTIPEVGDVNRIGSRTVNPDLSTTYKITATGAGGTATASAKVTVSPRIRPLEAFIIATRPTVTLTASPTTIERGQSSTLTWSSTNATKVTISSDIGVDIGDVTEVGSRTINPVSSTTYKITATGAAGTATASTKVIISTRRLVAPRDLKAK